MSCSTRRQRRSKTCRTKENSSVEMKRTSFVEPTCCALRIANIRASTWTSSGITWLNSNKFFDRTENLRNKSYCSFRCFIAHSQRVRICSWLSFSNDWIFSVVVPVTLCNNIFRFVPFIKSPRTLFSPCSNGINRMFIQAVNPRIRLASVSSMDIYNSSALSVKIEFNENNFSARWIETFQKL